MVELRQDLTTNFTTAVDGCVKFVVGRTGSNKVLLSGRESGHAGNRSRSGTGHRTERDEDPAVDADGAVVNVGGGEAGAEAFVAQVVGERQPVENRDASALTIRDGLVGFLLGI